MKYESDQNATYNSNGTDINYFKDDLTAFFNDPNVTAVVNDMGHFYASGAGGGNDGGYPGGGTGHYMEIMPVLMMLATTMQSQNKVKVKGLTGTTGIITATIGGVIGKVISRMAGAARNRASTSTNRLTQQEIVPAAAADTPAQPAGPQLPRIVTDADVNEALRNGIRVYFLYENGRIGYGRIVLLNGALHAPGNQGYNIATPVIQVLTEPVIRDAVRRALQSGAQPNALPVIYINPHHLEIPAHANLPILFHLSSFLTASRIAMQIREYLNSRPQMEALLDQVHQGLNAILGNMLRQRAGEIANLAQLRTLPFGEVNGHIAARALNNIFTDVINEFHIIVQNYIGQGSPFAAGTGPYVMYQHWQNNLGNHLTALHHAVVNDNGLIVDDHPLAVLAQRILTTFNNRNTNLASVMYNGASSVIPWNWMPQVFDRPAGGYGANNNANVNPQAAADVTLAAGATPANVRKLSAVQVAKLTASDAAGYSLASVQAFNKTQVATLSASFLSGTDSSGASTVLADLSTGASKTTNQIAWLTPTQLNASVTLTLADGTTSTTLLAAKLTPQAFAALSAAQIKGLSDATLATLSGTAIQALTKAQITGLTLSDLHITLGDKANVLAHFDADGIAALTKAQVQSLSVADIVALGTGTNGTTNQVAALTKSEWQWLSNTQIKAFTHDQYTAMTQPQHVWWTQHHKGVAAPQA
jgi:hypothetical protein